METTSSESGGDGGWSLWEIILSGCGAGGTHQDTWRAGDDGVELPVSLSTNWSLRDNKNVIQVFKGRLELAARSMK